VKRSSAASIRNFKQ